MSGKRGESAIRVLAVLSELTAQLGYPPTLRQIAEGIGASSTGHISYHIGKLVEDGYITQASRIARSYVLTEAGRQLLAKYNERVA